MAHRRSQTAVDATNGTQSRERARVNVLMCACPLLRWTLRMVPAAMCCLHARLCIAAFVDWYMRVADAVRALDSRWLRLRPHLLRTQSQLAVRVATLDLVQQRLRADAQEGSESAAFRVALMASVC